MEGKFCLVSLKNPKIEMRLSAVDYKREFLLDAFFICLYTLIPIKKICLYTSMRPFAMC